MLTKWYKSILKYLPISSSNMAYGPQVKSTDGATRYLKLKGTTGNAGIGMAPWIVPTVVVVNSSSYGIRLGTGTTAPTENDYSLESVITSGLSASVNSSSIRNSSGNIETIFAVTVTNTSTSDITIGEIGYYGLQPMHTSEGSAASSNYAIMYDRTLLNAPVTIGAGDSATINYRITANENSAS